jgi:hypothetical protein
VLSDPRKNKSKSKQKHLVFTLSRPQKSLTFFGFSSEFSTASGGMYLGMGQSIWEGIVRYYAYVVCVDGECYKTKDQVTYKEFELLVEKYRRCPDLVKGDSYKRFPDGSSEKIGSFWKKKSSQNLK